MLVKILSFLFCFSSLSLSAQSAWQSLSKVEYKKIKDETLGMDVDFPIFSKELKSLEGQKIKLAGYIIPTDGYKSHQEFVFSAFPYVSCFFCGAAGPETVIEVLMLKPLPFTSSRIELEGTLYLNNQDLNRLMFRMENVELVK